MKERIIVNEGDGADLLPDVVTREPAPANDVQPGLGPRLSCWCEACVERREEEAREAAEVAGRRAA